MSCSRFNEELGNLLDAVTFVAFGAILLGPALGHVTWSVALYAVLSLTVVRMVPVAIALIGSGAGWPTRAFVGWFGPRGLASIVFAVLVVEEADLPQTSTIVLGDVHHRRPVGVRPRRHRVAARRALRGVVRAPFGNAPGGDGGRRRGRAAHPRRRRRPAQVARGHSACRAPRQRRCRDDHSP